MLAWYVACVKTNLDFFAAANLRDQGFEVFLPAYREVKEKNGKRSMVVCPLYAGYIFVRFDVELHKWRSVNGTRGVVGLLASGPESPSRLPLGFIEELMKTVDNDGYFAVEKEKEVVKKFAVGDHVVVNTNAFNGLEGRVEKVTHNRVVVLLALLSQEIRAIIAPTHLERFS